VIVIEWGGGLIWTQWLSYIVNAISAILTLKPNFLIARSRAHQFETNK